MAAHPVTCNVKDESPPSYNTFETKEETEDHPAGTIQAEKKMESRYKLCWLCSFSCCSDGLKCKLFGCGSEETVSDDIEFALVDYIQVHKMFAPITNRNMKIMKTSFS